MTHFGENGWFRDQWPLHLLFYEPSINDYLELPLLMIRKCGPLTPQMLGLR